MKILLAEDGAVDALILKNILARAEHEVLVVANGAEALRTLEETDDVELVITDLEMPEMDGIELLRTIRAHPRHGDLPVFFVSSVADPVRLREAAALHPGGYVLKPINQPSRVLEMVAHATERARSHSQG